MFAPRAGRWLLGTAALLLFAAGWAVLERTPANLPIDVSFLVAAATWAFLANFFRDPERAAGPGVVSAADGRVSLVRREGDRLRIAVFMNVTDVHVNRFPLDATVVHVAEGGKGHAPAYESRAGGNVQREYRLETQLGEVTLIQVTGILARRLVSFVRAGEHYRKGDRLGMIVLGSRVDLLLPADRVEAVVGVGERVRAGVTPVARER